MNFTPEIWNLGLKDAIMSVSFFFFVDENRPFYCGVSLHWKFGPTM